MGVRIRCFMSVGIVGSLRRGKRSFTLKGEKFQCNLFLDVKGGSFPAAYGKIWSIPARSIPQAGRVIKVRR